MTDHRAYAPATIRNRDAILEVLRGVLPGSGSVLEIASGSGEHAVHFAAQLPGLTLQPSDPDATAVRSIAAWIETSGVTNVRPPLLLDVMQPNWPLASADAMLCINMIHISPWQASEALFAGAAAILAPGAPLYLYGPYRRDGVATAASNEDFDASLRRRNPAWGLRSLEAITALATSSGFAGPDVVDMPANNLSVIFRRI